MTHRRTRILWMILALVLLATATLAYGLENSAKPSTDIEQTSISKESIFTNKYGNDWDVRLDPRSGLPKQMIGGNIAVSQFNTSNIETGVRSFITSNKEIFNIDSSDISLVKEDYSPSLYPGKHGIQNIVYQQLYANISVYSSRIGVTTSDGKIVAIKSDYYPDININTQPKIDEEQALVIVGNDLGRNVVTPAQPRISFTLGETLKSASTDGSVKPESISLVIYPVKTANSYEYHLAYMVELNMLEDSLNKWVYFIDAHSAKVLYKYDKVIASNIDGTVAGTIYPEHTSQTPVSVPFRNETVSSIMGSNHVLYSGQGNNLHNSVINVAPINLAGASTVTLNFNTRYDIESGYDYAYAVISTDGSNFGIISQYTGTQSSWIGESFDISPYAGQNVWIGFAYITDPSVANKGFYADDISVDTNIGTLFSDDLENGSANWGFTGFNLINDVITTPLATTNTSGYYNISGLTGDTTIFSEFSGPYAMVYNHAQAASSVTNTLTPPATYNWNWNTIDVSDRQEESNMFYHVNVIHDYFTRGPPFDISDMDYQVMATVEYPGTCNAFSDGTDLYFYGAGGGCEATSLLSDVIYHEYTHNVVNHVYTVSPPYSGESGALNEGWADYFASTVNGNPCIGEGFLSGSDCLRNLINTNRYPDDIVGEVHDDSLIVSGAMWDTRVLLGVDLTDNLMIMSMKLEPLTFQEFVEDVLIVDDDNGDLNDGTPHINEIYEAFYVNHGIDTPYFDVINPSLITIAVSTDRTNYTAGDTVITTFNFKNPTATSMNTYFVWYLVAPDYSYVSSPLVVRPITLPSGFDQSFNVSTNMPNLGTNGLNLQWMVELRETSSPYNVISDDITDWQYVPTTPITNSTIDMETIVKIITAKIRSTQMGAMVK